MEVKEFSKKYDIPVTEVEDAYFEGKIDFYPTALFPTDWGDQYIDIKSDRNVEFITQKLLEKEIESQILKKQKKGLESARMKIAWYLSPNTRESAKKLAEGNNYLAYIIGKKDKIEQQLQQAEEDTFKKPENDEDDEVIERLTDKENAVLMSFYKRMWAQAGTEEFAESLKKASQIMQLYKTSRMDAIEDEEIKKIIQDCIN